MWQLMYLLLISSIFICKTNIFSYAEPINGNVRPARRGQFPFIVAIEEINKRREHTKNYQCAGTLITKKHVLTVSHCVENFFEVDLQVLVGCKNLNVCAKYEIDSWEIYDSWAWRNHVQKRYNDISNDVAIIRLFNDVTEPNVKPATLLRKETSVPFGSSVDLAGWGISNHGYFNAILQSVTLTLISPDECNLKINKIAATEIVDERNFCSVADPFTLMDIGDSGGPVVYNGNTVIGFHKAIYGLKNIPLEKNVNIHMNINFFRDFIDDVISKN